MVNNIKFYGKRDATYFYNECLIGIGWNGTVQGSTFSNKIYLIRCNFLFFMAFESHNLHEKFGFIFLKKARLNLKRFKLTNLSHLSSKMSFFVLKKSQGIPFILQSNIKPPRLLYIIFTHNDQNLCKPPTKSTINP